MKNGIVILLLMIGLSPGLAVAERWTNAAGHGIEARLVSLENESVTLQPPKGRPFTIKLSSFCAADQKRIRKHFGLAKTPRPVSAKDLAYEKQMQRLRQLHDCGKLDDEEFLLQQNAMLDHFYGKKPE